MVYTCIIISNLCMRVIKSEEVCYSKQMSNNQKVIFQVKWSWQVLFLASDSIAVISLFYGITRQHAAFLQPFTVLSVSLQNHLKNRKIVLQNYIKTIFT